MEMKSKTMVCVLCLLASTLASFAQVSVSMSKDIAKIKRDTKNLYAEATMKDSVEAINGAKAILEKMVGEWVHQQFPDESIELCIVKAKEHCQLLQTRRGDFYRAFVYVKKNDIIPVTDKSEVAVFQVEPVSEQPSVSSVAEVTSANLVQPSVVLTEEEKRMADIRLFNDIQPYVNGLKQSGLLKDYGKYATMPTNAPCHLFIYDKEGLVVAVLRSTVDGQVNLNTLQQDNVKKYKNCGAIWFQLKSTNL